MERFYAKVGCKNCVVVEAFYSGTGLRGLLE